MSLRLYDTLRREKVVFEPRDEGKASLYICGPTVQADPHIGHGRSQVVFDILRRWLEFRGLDVTLVCNITDVDDKIILRATREKVSPHLVATTYTRAWNEAMAALNVIPPDIAPTATGHILEMQSLIAELLEQDKAYVVDGNVLFRVRSFADYGKLSGRRVDEMQAGEDLVASDIKQDPLDFAMWKAAKPGEPSWPSPWGDGRPGWHIECAAMAAKHLGGGFDIHGGGFDLVFPHHENEITQYEAATGKTFANHWVHNGMLTLGEEKMSKSLGNVISLREALDEWGVGPLRLWYLSAHHRSPLVYDDEPVRDAVMTVGRFLTFLVTMTATLRSHADTLGLQAAAMGRTSAVEVDGLDADDRLAAPLLERFTAAMDDDLNVPRAVAVLHEVVAVGFERLKALDGGEVAAAAEVLGLARLLVELTDRVLGLRLADAAAATWRDAERLTDVVADLLLRRGTARADKDFATADAIRDQIASLGVIVEDRPSGPRWYLDPSARATRNP